MIYNFIIGVVKSNEQEAQNFKQLTSVCMGAL